MLAIKKLTASDLTFFEWHYRNHSAGNQKAINLNADVFIDELYPSLPLTREGLRGRMPIELFLYGPGHAGEYNLARKIVKLDSYKNWRLDGEFIYTPGDDPKRFEALAPGDYVLLDFIGTLLPEQCRAVLIARKLTEDSALHAEISKKFGEKTMIHVPRVALAGIVSAADPVAAHPVYELTLDADLEDAAGGGAEGARRLQKRASGRRMSAEDLERARRKAGEIGRVGEELVNAHLELRKRDGEIQDYKWVSQSNAVAPFDFRIIRAKQPEDFIDAKATVGEFSRPIHVSVNELREMAACAGKYAIYRVYEIGDRTAKLRIANDVREFGTTVLARLDGLPTGVSADSVSIQPSTMEFGDEIVLSLPDLLSDE